MTDSILKINMSDYLIPQLPDDDAPTRKCRAVICDVYIEETDREEGLGNIDIAFLLLSSSFEEPYIYEKHLTNWSLEGGIEAAFQGLVPDDLVESFYDLIGTVFDAEIEYGVRDNQMCADLVLQRMITPPQIIED